MGLNSLLHEVIDQNAATNSDEETDEKPDKAAVELAEGLSAFDALKAGVSSNSETLEDGSIKAQDDAIDYSDINELSEDCPRTPSPPPAAANESTTAATYDDLEDAIPATKVEAKSSKCTHSYRSEFLSNNNIPNYSQRR